VYLSATNGNRTSETVIKVKRKIAGGLKHIGRYSMPEIGMSQGAICQTGNLKACNKSCEAIGHVKYNYFPRKEFAMSLTSKIDEWMKEVEERPESAVTIVRLVVRRLRELSERNEELLAENIALQSGTRVEEYQKRIAHLEYQLDMLKQRFGMDQSPMADIFSQAEGTSTLNLLVYNAQGRIFRVELDSVTKEVGHISGEMITDHEPPRLLAVPSNENLLLLFTSGRVETYSANNIPTVQPGGPWTWDQAALPNEPHAGEQLACIVPFSRLPLSDFLLQISRRGYAKKTLTTISESILSNHFIGKGATQKSDQPFDLTLSRKNDRAALVTYEGKTVAFDVEKLSYATEERIRLSVTDYVVGSFIMPEDTSLLCVTQTGKVIHRESQSIEVAKSSSSKGQALIPPARLEQGVRFMGAAAVKDSDQVAVLDAAGRINIHDVSEMTGSGSIQAGELILSMGLVQPEGGKKRSAS
jgi:DNA gyrase/topoisomerase IV subunit A